MKQDINIQPAEKLESGYTGWALPDHERAALLQLIPPVYPDIIAHHVTDQFGVTSDAPLPDATAGDVVGVADDGKVQALIVSINGSTKRQDGGTYHITWSLDRSAGTKPVDANKAVKSHPRPLDEVTPISSVHIGLTPKFFVIEQEQPKQKKAKTQKPMGSKEVQVSSTISENDLQVKIKTIVRLIGQNNRVRIALRLKGRQITRTDVAFQVMDRVVAGVEAEGKVVMAPKLDGRQIIMIVLPKGKKG